MAYGVSTLAVASYHCIMCILAMSICIEPDQWESHITIPECYWAKSVRKLYDYSGVLLWIMSPLAGRDRTDTASYVARGGVRCNFIPCWVWRQWTCICIAFAPFEVYSYILSINVGIKWICGVLFYSYVEVVYLFYHVLNFFMENFVKLIILSWTFYLLLWHGFFYD